MMRRSVAAFGAGLLLATPAAWAQNNTGPIAQETTAIGRTNDMPWSGAGYGSLIAISKSVRTLLANILAVQVQPQSAPALTAGRSLAAESSHIISSAPARLWSAYVTTGATGGFLQTYNQASVPSDAGSGMTPVECVIAPANQTTGIDFGSGPPDLYSNGIIITFSIGASCQIKTASNAFFKWRAN